MQTAVVKDHAFVVAQQSKQKCLGLIAKCLSCLKECLFGKKGQYRQAGWQKILHNLNELHMTANFVIKLGIVFIT